MSEHADPVMVAGPGGLVDRVEDLLFRVQTCRYRGLIGFAALVLAVSTALAGWWFGPTGGADELDATIPMASGAEDGSGSPVELASKPSIPEAVTTVSAEPDRPAIVHVSGEVANPGLVELPPGSRVADAIEAAGGPTEEGDVHRLNLAAVLGDGIQIVVPAFGEENPGPLLRQGLSITDDSSVGPGVPVLVNLNTASLIELETLPGIGPATSAAIDEWRTENGPFLSVDDLLEVPGIGPAKLERLASRVTV